MFIDNAAVNREATAALLAFAQAIGYDAPVNATYGASEVISAWTFHQQLLLRAECCNQAVVALRHHIVRVLREWAIAGAPTGVARHLDSNDSDTKAGETVGSGLRAPPPPPQHMRRMPDVVRALLQVGDERDGSCCALVSS